MRKEIKNLAMAIVAIAAVGCASPEKMAEMAESVTVTCDPSPLEVLAGKIDATVSVTYPADYFHKKAILEVTPVIVFDGGEAAMTPFMYQGEKVKDNYTVVSSDGQTVTEKVHFDYVEGMEACHLELRGVVIYKARTWDLPIKKVAEIATGGTTPVFYYDSGMNTIEQISTASEPIGVDKESSYKDILQDIKTGDILVTYTDGLVEALNEQGQQYPKESLLKIVSLNASKSGKDIANLVKADIKKYIGNSSQHDDQSLLVIKF